MHSKLFSKFDAKDERNKGFVQALEDTLSLTPQQWNTIATALPFLLAARTHEEREPLVAKLEAATKLTRVVLSRVTSLAGFFVGPPDGPEGEEDPNLWAADLRSVGLLTAETEKRFIEFMMFLKMQISPKVESLGRERMAETGVLPSFSGASTTVELRGVFKRPFKWGIDVDDYTPEVVSVRPIVSVAIAVDSGVTKVFTFQAAPDEIGYLIAELRAAQKCASVLESRIPKV